MSDLDSADRPGRASELRHDELSWLTRLWEFSCIVVAVTLLGVLGVREWSSVVAHPALLLWAVGGALAADFVSGLVHWTADTWGSETMPLLGRRFVRPFRVHHVNPDDFLRRDFIDCNGDVAMLTLPVLVFGHWVAGRSSWGEAAAIFCLGFCAVGLPTNQVHQWAHMRRAPRAIRWLQRWGLILGRPAHARHHCPPHVANYCIATGWCNRPLAAIGFFARLERVVTWLTGIQPRADDDAFARSVSGGDAVRELREGEAAKV